MALQRHYGGLEVVQVHIVRIVGHTGTYRVITGGQELVQRHKNAFESGP